jgi:hypothetical protein
VARFLPAVAGYLLERKFAIWPDRWKAPNVRLWPSWAAPRSWTRSV